MHCQWLSLSSIESLANDDSDSLPVPDEVVDLFERMEQIRRETEGQ
jgi:hypothetical protein